MTCTQKFIEDIIKGGWNDQLDRDIEHRLAAGYLKYHDVEGFSLKEPIAEILLDPEAWRCCGVTRGWWDAEKLPRARNAGRNSAWQAKQHQFITHLQEGLSVDEALSKL